MFVRGRRRISDKAEVGVGTLIIFIAMVLVAAVAAAVIIGTSGSLQQRSMATGKEATTEVSSNLRVLAIYGIRNNTSSNLWDFKIWMELPAGGQNVDLSTLVVRFADGTNVRNHALNATPGFTLSWIRGTGTNNVIKTGDIAALTFNATSGEVAPRADFSVHIIPEVGSPVQLDLRTPATYASDTTVTIQR